MRATEFTTEESMRDFMYDEVASKLEQSGYRELGSGAEAIVYTKDDGSVIKILLPEDDENDTSVHTFKNFIDFCVQNSQYSNLPKIKELNDPKVKQYLSDAGLYGVVMEKLKPIRNHSFEEAMVWILSEFSTNKMTWLEVADKIKDPATWQHYDELPTDKIINTFSKLNNKQLMEYEVLFKMMALLYHKGRINKYGWDLHTENVMQRDDGTLVIIDPWFNIYTDMI